MFEETAALVGSKPSLARPGYAFNDEEGRVE